jgi:NAD(P)-dependent dehydrogenase (short-subunit alcohol dehydrogenase family)
MSVETCVIVAGAAGFLGNALVRAAEAAPEVSRVLAVTRRPDVRGLEGSDVRGGIDLADPNGIAVLREAIEGLDEPRIALIHCVGNFPRLAPLHRTSLEDFTRTIDSNLTTFVGVMQAVVPAMRRRRWGRLLAFSAHARAENYPFMGSFNVAKAALEAAVQTAANENARYGIAVNAISIATLNTEVEKELKPTGSFSDWLEPADVAGFALDLALSGPIHLNGSIVHYWHHSDSFFGESAFARNSIDRDTLDPEE